MSIRAVIFDVYRTLLEIGDPPANPDLAWQRLFQEMLRSQPRLSWVEFTTASQQVIARRHALARARGIAWPEILWPSIVAEVVPEILGLSPHDQEEFIYRQIQIIHTIRLCPDAVSTLRWLNEHNCLLGIASNAQAYTLRELREGLQAYQLDLALFQPDLCFWSFAHGFSKPDPRVFQLLTLRLEQRGIAPQETLMVGDNIENELAPATAFGWQTWQLISSGTCPRSHAPPGHTGLPGDWKELAEHLHPAISHNFSKILIPARVFRAMSIFAFWPHFLFG